MKYVQYSDVFLFILTLFTSGTTRKGKNVAVLSDQRRREQEHSLCQVRAAIISVADVIMWYQLTHLPFRLSKV